VQQLALTGLLRNPQAGSNREKLDTWLARLTARETTLAA
jgi:hypothetical protein